VKEPTSVQSPAIIKSSSTKGEKMNAKDLIKRIKEDKVNFISLQFTDVMGAVKSVDMPLHNLEGALEDGVWFDGSSVEGFARIQESDMRLVLDPDTYAVLPWSPEDRRRARVFCDIFMPDGKPFEGSARRVEADAHQTVQTRLEIQHRSRTGVLPVQGNERSWGTSRTSRCGQLL